MSELAKRATTALWWSVLEIATRYGVQFGVMILLARLLTPADFGLVAMLLVFTTFATLLVDSGFGTALVQKQHTSDDEETTVFISGLAISIVVSGTLWLAAPAIATFYAEPTLLPLTRLLIWALPLNAVAAVPDALLTQELDFRARANAEIFASLGSGALAIFLAWRGFGVWSLAWQSIVATGVRALLLWVFSGWRPRGRFRGGCFRGLFGFGSYMLMANLLNTIYIRLQSMLIGKLFDSRALGYYTLAQNTQQAPAQFISGVLNRVGLPVFSAVNDQPAKLVGALRLSLRVTLFVFMPCMVGIAVVAKPLIVMLYGQRWAPAAPLLSILAISATFWPLHVLNLAAIGAQGRSDLIFRLEVIKRVVSISLVLTSSPFGPIAIAWAVLAASVFGVVINTWYSKQNLDYGMLAQLHDQIGTVLLSGMAALAGWLVLRGLPPGAFALMSAMGAAATAYLGGAALCRHPALADLLGLMRTISSDKTLRRASADRFGT